MRAIALTFLGLSGCVGGANLGLAPSVQLDDLDASADAQAARASVDAALGLADASGATPLLVQIASAPSATCGCYELTAHGPDANAAVQWEDGSDGAMRQVCPTAGASYRATVHSDAGVGTGTITLTAPSCSDAAVVDPLCLANRSFDHDLGTLTTPLSEGFGAAPWRACGDNAPNLPMVVDDSLTPNLPATDGNTYLSLGVDEQVSQAPCATLPVGAARSFTLDLAEISNDVVSATMVGAVLQIWGGLALDCSQRELLWTSEPLTGAWQHSCVTIEPTMTTDNLTLRAVSTGTLPYPGRVFVDHIVPVDSCP